MTPIVKTSCSGCCICTLTCLYHRSRRSVAAHASPSRRGTLLELRTAILEQRTAVEEVYRAWQAWGLWVLTALILFYIGKKVRLTPLPFYLSLPTILTLPVVETSKATIAFYVKSALDIKAWLKEVDQHFSWLAIVIVMVLCVYLCF